MKWLFAFLCIYASCAFGEVRTFAPPNNLQVYESADYEANRIAKASFERAINLVTKTYASEIYQKYGAILQINNYWSDGTVNAQAYRQGNYFMIDAFGGLARYGRMTTAAYVGVLCHELGHHVGGRPRSGWASVEGQSDYWGFAACMLRVYSKTVAQNAGLRLAEVLASLGGEPVPHINTPDPTVVSSTMVEHPPAQCRLYTFIAAILGCPRPRCWFKP